MMSSKTKIETSIAKVKKLEEVAHSGMNTSFYKERIKTADKFGQ
jgi:hypothetical protein